MLVLKLASVVLRLAKKNLLRQVVGAGILAVNKKKHGKPH